VRTEGYTQGTLTRLSYIHIINSYIDDQSNFKFLLFSSSGQPAGFRKFSFIFEVEIGIYLKDLIISVKMRVRATESDDIKR